MKNRFAKRTDGNQAEIVKHLRKHTGQVIVTNMGDDFPDLLCATFGGWVLLEVKELSGCLDRGQLKFLRDCQGAVAVVTDKYEAFNAVYGGDEQLSQWQKDEIGKWLLRNPTQETLSVKKFQKMISGSNGSTCSKK